METFEIICAELYPHIFKNEKRFRNAVLLHKHVVVTFCYLSDEENMMKTPNAFRIGKSTVLTIAKRVAKAIAIWLQSTCICLAQSEMFKKW